MANSKEFDFKAESPKSMLEYQALFLVHKYRYLFEGEDQAEAKVLDFYFNDKYTNEIFSRKMD